MVLKAELRISFLYFNAMLLHSKLPNVVSILEQKDVKIFLQTLLPSNDKPFIKGCS